MNNNEPPPPCIIIMDMNQCEVPPYGEVPHVRQVNCPGQMVSREQQQQRQQQHEGDFLSMWLVVMVMVMVSGSLETTENNNTL